MGSQIRQHLDLKDHPYHTDRNRRICDLGDRSTCVRYALILLPTVKDMLIRAAQLTISCGTMKFTEHVPGQALPFLFCTFYCYSLSQAHTFDYCIPLSPTLAIHNEVLNGVAKPNWKLQKRRPPCTGRDHQQMGTMMAKVRHLH